MLPPTVRHLPKLLFAIAITTALTIAAAETVKFEIEKSHKRYVDYPIPAEELAFTSEVRRFEIPGKLFEKPAIIRPDAQASPQEPLGVVARYLSAAKTGDTEKVLALYDENSQKFIRSLPPEQIKRGVEVAAATEFYEVGLLLDRGPVLFLYAYKITSAGKSLTTHRLAKVGNEYRMAAGETTVSIKYEQSLMTLLSEHGFGALKKSAD